MEPGAGEEWFRHIPVRLHTASGVVQKLVKGVSEVRTFVKSGQSIVNCFNAVKSLIGNRQTSKMPNQALLDIWPEMKILK